MSELHSWARELEHTHPKLMAEARRRRRREIARYRWPKISAVKTEYHRRRR